MRPTPDRQPVIARLRALAATRPIVVAHRGNSRLHPENTLPAFTSARELGAPMQEFDVQVTADDQLVCIHDLTLDRTTDAALRLGPGALVRGTTLATLEQLDAGSWKGPSHVGTRVPTLAAALAAMLPRSIPMIEHKGGSAAAFVDELRRLGHMSAVLLQSFDWAFVAAVADRTPDIALGVLGPTATHPKLDATVVAAARASGVGLLHWHAPELTTAAIDLVRAAGLLLCTYTSDDELSWHGGRALGVDAMCSNDPGRMLASLRRSAP